MLAEQDIAIKPIGATPRYKWELMVWLWLAYFLNQADRQIFSVVLPLIKAELQLSDVSLGLIASSLVCTYGILVPVAGFAGDRLSKKYIIGFSLLFWSCATLCTGLSFTLVQFILLRGIATGGGEAFYAPAANTLISETHQKTRSLALSVHQSAVYFGIILSGLVAGYFAEKYGWRSAFYLFGGFGLLVGIIIFFRLRRDVPQLTEVRPNMLESVKVFAQQPIVALLTLAFACMVFVNVGYLNWMPTLLGEKFNLSISASGFSSVFYHHVGAFIGVIVGGIIADKLAALNPGYRMLLQGIALLTGAPFIYLMGQSATAGGTYWALFLFGIFRGVYDANIFASLYEVVRPAIRSSVSGLMLMCAFLVGALGPVMLAVLKGQMPLANSISWLWLPYVFGGVLLCLAFYLFTKQDRKV